RPRGVFDLPGKQERLTALEARASEPGFWDDSRTAQDVLREADGLRAEQVLWSGLLARTDDLETALELAQEAGDAELEAEVDRTVDALERDFNRERTQLLFNGEEDGRAAIPSHSARRRG